MSKAIVNTFKKLDTDTSQNKQDPSSFYDAQDLRLISDEPLSNGALVNYKGTKAKINLGSPLNKVVGYAEVGSDLVLLSSTIPIYSVEQSISSVKFGKLYNGYAVSDARNIAPVGWHIPTHDEFITLITYLGGWLVAGKKLKETGISHWKSPNNESTNEVGFSALPGGYYYDSLFTNIGTAGNLWTSTDAISDYLFSYAYYSDSSQYHSGALEVNVNHKSHGFSIRCIKDSIDITNSNVTDIDGNIYHTVTIGTQTWMVENLKVTKYRNGDSILNDFSGSVGAFVNYDKLNYTLTEGGIITNSITNYISSVSLSEDNSLQSPTLLYSTGNNGLGFAEVDYVETIGRYENEFSKKIYFAVPDQQLRVFNIYTPSGFIPSTSLPSTLDIIPNNSGSILSFDNDSIIQGGTITSGKIQYACRLFNKYGSESTFSSCSELISLTPSNIGDSSEFKGGDLETNSNKSVRVNISLPNYDFKYIHIYSINYKVKGTPVISLVGELSVPSNYNSFSFIDSGIILDTITLEEFNIFGGSLISAKTIGTKNNILFAANTKEISDTIDLDCRAYRYGNNIEIQLENSIAVNSWTNTEIEFTTTIPRTSRVGWIYLDLPGTIPSAYYKVKSVDSFGTTIVILHNNIPIQSGTINVLHDNYKQSLLYQSDDSYYILDSNGRWVYKNASNVSISWGDNNVAIPLDSDCINKYNNEFEKTSGALIHQFLFDKQSNGTTIGGSGKIVSYEIKVGDPVKLMDNGETIVNSSNINFILKETSFKQGETYRFGLTAYDLKGKPYFTNWIGDVRIPYFTGANSIFNSTAYGVSSVYANNVEVTSKNIYIEFSISAANIETYYPGTLDKISGFQIVNVERTIGDKSVIAQGCSIGGAAYSNSKKSFLSRSLPPASSLLDPAEDRNSNIDYIHTFYSPEFNINGGLDSSSNHRLYVNKILSFPLIKTVGVSGWDSDYKRACDLSGDFSRASSIFYPINNRDSYGVVTSTELSSISSIYPGTSFNINNANKVSIAENNGATISLDANSLSVKYSNRTYGPYTAEGHTGYGQTGIILSSNTALPVRNPSFSTIYDIEITYILDLYVDNANSRYGGNTYLARTLNEYIKSSGFISKESVVSGTKLTAHGDVYNTIWDSITAGVDPNVDDITESPTGTSWAGIDRRQIVSLLPLESSINCFLTGSKPSKYILQYPSGKDKNSVNIGLAETQVMGINLWGSKYPNIGDFNSYNTAHSSTPKYPTFFPKPNIFDIFTEKNNFIYASEKKINGEYVDSWSKFLYANSLEVEGVYGAIHKLTTLDNKLYFFQEGAIGVAAVNDRYIIGQGDAAKLSLGTGTVLERYDYVKYNEGIIKPEHVINTITNLYFIDHNRKVIDIIGNSDIALSIEKGVNTLFRYLYKDSNTYVTIGFDPVFREVYFNINNGTDKTNKTLVYNENLNMFQPRSSARPDLFLSISDGLLSFKQSNDIPDIKNYIYKHNAGEIGELYSESLTANKYDLLDLGTSGTINPDIILDGGSSELLIYDIIDGGYSLPDATILKHYEPSSVSILVNTNSTGVFVADNVEFRTEVRSYNEDKSIFDDSFSVIKDNEEVIAIAGDVLETVDNIEFKNSYQSVSRDTIVKQDNHLSAPGVIPNTSRRHRSWTTTVPMPKDAITNNSTRFVDTFLSMKFTFNNRDNKVFKLHDITTYIRPTHK